MAKSKKSSSHEAAAYAREYRAKMKEKRQKQNTQHQELEKTCELQSNEIAQLKAQLTAYRDIQTALICAANQASTADLTPPTTAALFTPSILELIAKEVRKLTDKPLTTPPPSQHSTPQLFGLAELPGLTVDPDNLFLQLT